MDTGAFLFFLLAFLLLAWLALDVTVYMKGGQTASQWVIEASKRDRVFAWLLLAVVILVPIVLVLHWELLEILL